MKKIYTVVAAVMFLSMSAKSQQQTFTESNNVGHHIKYNNATANDNFVSSKMYIIGNPVKDVITLQISNPNQTKYELSLYSVTGRKLISMLYDHPAGVSTKQIYVSELQHGMYYLVATSEYEKRSLKILVQ